MMRQLLKIIMLNAGLVLILVSFALCDQAEQLTITTYYPSPYGSYNELQLYPHASGVTPCNNNTKGTIYLDSDDNLLHICDGSGSWPLLGGGASSAGGWTDDGTDVRLTTITDKVGIGVANPEAKLQISDNYNGGGTGLVHLQSSGVESGITMEKTGGTNGTQRYKIGVLADKKFSIVNETSGREVFSIDVHNNLYATQLMLNDSLSANNAYFMGPGQVEVQKSLAVWGGITVHSGGLTVASGTKNFEINHPIKPGYKLVHSTLEGPEIGVFYRGESILSNGQAEIILPDYFEALTRKKGRTVYLTAEGDEPYLLSASAVAGGKFIVYGTKKNGKFFWEVKAVRADIDPLEVEKRSDGSSGRVPSSANSGRIPGANSGAKNSGDTILNS